MPRQKLSCSLVLYLVIILPGGTWQALDGNIYNYFLVLNSLFWIPLKCSKRKNAFLEEKKRYLIQTLWKSSSGIYCSVLLLKIGHIKFAIYYISFEYYFDHRPMYLLFLCISVDFVIKEIIRRKLFRQTLPTSFLP